jgi:hypothetical protein
MRNIRERVIWRNGRTAIAYQVRVRLQDDRGALRTRTQTFDNLADALLWRDTTRSQVQQSERRGVAHVQHSCPHFGRFYSLFLPIGA